MPYIDESWVRSYKQTVVVVKAVRLRFFGFFMVSWHKQLARGIHIRYEGEIEAGSHVGKLLECF